MFVYVMGAIEAKALGSIAMGSAFNASAEFEKIGGSDMKPLSIDEVVAVYKDADTDSK